MLRLRPYKACDAQAITKWIKDEHSFYQWSADRFGHYPIVPKDMNDYYDQNKDNDSFWAMTAFDDSGLVGHLIMRFPDSDRSKLRFGFVIVNDSLRGRGYGKEMLTLAAKYAFEIVKVQRITLGVFENNERARRCYESCGFRAVKGAEPERYECMGELWNCIEMEMTKQTV